MDGKTNHFAGIFRSVQAGKAPSPPYYVTLVTLITEFFEAAVVWTVHLGVVT